MSTHNSYCSEIANFSYPPPFNTPRYEWPVGISRRFLMCKKTSMMGLPGGNKSLSA